MKKFYLITGIYLLSLVILARDITGFFLLTLGWAVLLGIFFLPSWLSKFLFSLKNRLFFSHILASVIPTILVFFLILLFLYIMLASFSNSLIQGWIDLKMEYLKSGGGEILHFPLRKGFEGILEDKNGYYLVVFNEEQHGIKIDKTMPEFFRREYLVDVVFPPILFWYEKGKLKFTGASPASEVRGITVPVILSLEAYSVKTGREYAGVFFPVKATLSSLVNGLLKGKTVIGTRMFFLFLFLAVLFSFVNLGAIIGGMWISRDVAKAVSELSFAVQAVKAGDLSVKIQTSRRDEIGMLLRDFDAMVERLRQLVEKEKTASEMAQELRIARKIQLKLLPPQKIIIPQMNYAAITLAAKGVGGDFYDIIKGGKGWYISMADVSGKGLHSSLYGAMLKGTLLSLLSRGVSPEEAVVKVNSLLFPYLRPNYFITLAILKIEGREVEYVRAGHTPLIIHRPLSQSGIDRLEYLTPEGMGIGLVEDLRGKLETSKFSLSQGDSLLLFTDGLSELPSKDGRELFGIERIGAVLRKYHRLSPKEIMSRILQEAEAFSGREVPPDDIAIFLGRIV